MKRFLYVFAALIYLGCNNKTHDEHHNKEHQSEHATHKHETSNSANNHMHNSSVLDLIKRFESPERDAYQKPDSVIKYLGNLKGLKIMDIGAGSGYFSVRLAEQGAHVIAADVDDQFLEYIQKRIDKDKLKNIELRKIPYDAPNLNDQEVDKVLIVNTYHHIENRSAYFQKVLKGTKDSGELVLIDFFKTDSPVGPPSHHKLSIDVVISELKQAGYTNFNVNVDLLPYQYIIKASK